ncbi:glycosyltransferase family 4 protein [Undibacterium sp. Di24W]|uniref:glycosyltransferase family 4 protein n=1 Tax=Undibacterium sp. Di24W TaxID=3413033 RepID=UPI003BF53967
MQSVAKHHPNADRYCVIVDTDLSYASELKEEFTTLTLPQLNLPFGDEFTFQYTILELNTAVKPWALEHLLDAGYDQVLYIDPDIYLYNPLTEVNDLLSAGASIVLTPHLLAPMTDEKNPTELDIRIAGTYNLGFCALSNQGNTRDFLHWWQGKLKRDCVVDFKRGVFVDQSWIDLVPTIFEHVKILRHHGYNVAYWNMAQREITENVDGDILVNGDPLTFFHFSGLNPSNPQPFSKHQNRFRMDSLDPLTSRLAMDYCETVRANGIEKYRAVPYGFGFFQDGRPIPDTARRDFRENETFRKTLKQSPFAQKADIVVDDSPATNARIERVYDYFLWRKPEPDALKRYHVIVGTTRGYYTLLLGVALSPESRKQPRWIRRVLFWPLWRLLQNTLARTDSLAIAEKPASTAKPSKPTKQITALNSKPITTRGINLIGYIAAELGIGEATRSLARACSAVNVPYSVVDVGFQSSNLQRDTQALKNASKEHFAIDLVYVNADQTESTIKHLQDLKHESTYKIGFWHWEQPQIPATHIAAFADLDEVWVPSNFVRDAVAAVSPVPVIVIPHALQFEATPAVQRSSFGLPENKVLALVMYDFHSYQHRKNPKAAIAAFRLATQNRDDAVLVVKTINRDKHPEASQELADYLADLPNTVIIDDFLTRQQTWDLQYCCDLLISLHRAEGFGLAPAEMMYLGKAVVATGWSANMDFMTASNSMPVDFKLKPLEHAVGAYPAGPLWAEADIEHAADCITQLLDQPELRSRLGKQATLDIRRLLNPETVGRTVAARLQTIIDWHNRDL